MKERDDELIQVLDEASNDLDKALAPEDEQEDELEKAKKKLEKEKDEGAPKDLNPEDVFGPEEEEEEEETGEEEEEEEKKKAKKAQEFDLDSESQEWLAKSLGEEMDVEEALEVSPLIENIAKSLVKHEKAILKLAKSLSRANALIETLVDAKAKELKRTAPIFKAMNDFLNQPRPKRGVTQAMPVKVLQKAGTETEQIDPRVAMAKLEKAVEKGKVPVTELTKAEMTGQISPDVWEKIKDL